MTQSLIDFYSSRFIENMVNLESIVALTSANQKFIFTKYPGFTSRE